MQRQVTTHTESLIKEASRLENQVRHLNADGKQEILDAVFDGVCELANQRKYDQAGLLLAYISKRLLLNRGK